MKRSLEPLSVPRIRLRRRAVIFLVLVLLGPPVAAWGHFLLLGLPPTRGNADPANPHGPHQFPAWIRAWHYVNLLLVILMTRTGSRIWLARPWLAWTESGSRWLELPPPRSAGVEPPHRPHAALAIAWGAIGVLDVALIVLAGEADHLVPFSGTTAEAWHVFVQYATFHLPLAPDGFFRYNSLQLLSYAAVQFGFVPLIVLTGLAISPAFGGGFDRLVRLFGNREAARSIHYLAIAAYLLFVAIHVTFVVMYAAWLNGHHVVMETDETGLPGCLIGAAGLGLIGLAWWAFRRLAR